MSGDPIRLLDDPGAGSLLRADLAAAGQARLQGLDAAAGLASLQATLGAETGAIPAVASGGATSVIAKALVAAAVVAGVLWWSLRDDGASSAVSAPIASAPVDPPVPASGAATPVAVPPAPVVSAPLPVSAPPPMAEAELEVDTAAPDEEPEPEPEPQPRVRPSKAAPSSGPPSAIDDAVVREAKKVQAARRALGSDAARALALTEAVAREFPHGQLVEERRAIAIQALAKLGRMDEAQSRAASFLEEHGRGPHAAAVRRAIGSAGG